jgi:pimeloyl-ACP methyl ester carboxylesterase
LVGGRFRSDEELTRRYAALRVAHPPSLRGYYFQMLGAATWTTLGLLPAIRQPALVITGDDDPLVSQWNARILATCIPRGRLHVVPGGGHILPFERPRELAAIVEGFLERR